MGKATIRDVAREAGVSTATVSYIFNNNTDQKISCETVKKVLQIANLLSYKQNYFAKNLSVRIHEAGSRIVALLNGRGEESGLDREEGISFYALETMHLARALLPCLNKEGYDLHILPDASPRQLSNIDAVLAYNFSTENFYRLGDANYIPIIAIDSLLNDSFFYRVSTDYHRLRLSAEAFFRDEDFFYLALEPASVELRNTILACMPHTHFVSKRPDLENILRKLHHGAHHSNLCLNSPTLLEEGARYFRERPNVFYYNENREARLEAILRCLEYALGRAENREHIYEI
jgi:hypothetical protein